MKILHIISQTPDFTGSGKFIQEIIRQSCEHQFENFLVAGAQAEFKLDESILSKENCLFVRFGGLDLDFSIPGMSDVMPYQSSIFSCLSDNDLKAYQRIFSAKIQEAVEKFKPDILHTHHLWVVSALTRSIAADIPMVATCHGTCLRQHYLCPNIGPQITKDLERIDQIIALSQDQKQHISKTLRIDPEKINIISGGFNKDLFFFKPKEFDGVAEFLYAGKLSSFKGVPWLLKSFKKINDMPFRLHIAGSSSGKEREDCLNLAKELGQKVIYHGSLNHEDLSRLMQKVHVFILPSFFEGVPLVLMEALACGCRIVTTGLPGVKEIFGSGHDPMVKMIELPELETIDTPYKKDIPYLESLLAATLKQSIESMLKFSEPDLEYVKRAVSDFTWQKIFLKTKSVYEKAIS